MPIVGPIIVIAYLLLTIVFNSLKLIAQIIKTITFNLKEILQKRQRAKTAIKAKNLERTDIAIFTSQKIQIFI